MRASRFFSLCHLAMLTLIAFGFLSCDQTAQPTEQDRGSGKVEAKEGSTFTFQLRYRTSQEDQLDTVSQRLISTTATIGGRDDLIAFMSSNGETEFWDHDAAGDLWQFIREPIGTTTDGTLTSNGTWLRLPMSGTRMDTTVIVDTTLALEWYSIRTRVQMTTRYLGPEKVDLAGQTWLAHALHVSYESEKWYDGVLSNQGYHYEGTRRYIPALAIVASVEDSVVMPSISYVFQSTLTELNLK